MGWIERTIHLSQGLSAEPGPVRLWPYQRETANAIKDLACERVTMLKPTRRRGSTASAPHHRTAWPWPPRVAAGRASAARPETVQRASKPVGLRLDAANLGKRAPTAL